MKATSCNDINHLIIQSQKKLTVLCAELFLLAIKLKNSETNCDPQDLRKMILFLTDIVIKRCKECEFNEKTINQIVYPLICFIDETVLSNPGKCRESWLNNPLQLHLYGELNAGEKFYKMIDEIMNSEFVNSEILEIYYICLSLGFEGKYKLHNRVEREIITDKIYNIIKKYNNDDYNNEITRNKIENKVKKISPWLYISIMTLITASIYCIVMIRINLFRIDNLILIVNKLNP